MVAVVAPPTRAIAAGLALLFLAACAVHPDHSAAVDPKLLVACKSSYKSHDWQLSDPPEPATTRMFSVPRDATTQLWFRGRDKAIAVCTPCGVASAAGASAVRSFEWYRADFKDGELNLKNCSASGVQSGGSR